MNIGLDFDGVLSDCGRLKSEHAKRRYGVEIPPERFKKELVFGQGLLTPDQYRELQEEIYGNREIGLTMEPVEGMLTFLPRLLDEGHELSIITSRPAGVHIEIAREWLSCHGIDLPFTGVGHGKSKAGVMDGVEIFVDDDLDKLEPLVSVVPHRFLFSWGYNRHLDETGIADRVHSWEDLYASIQRIHEGQAVIA